MYHNNIKLHPTAIVGVCGIINSLNNLAASNECLSADFKITDIDEINNILKNNSYTLTKVSIEDMLKNIKGYLLSIKVRGFKDNDGYLLYTDGYIESITNEIKNILENMEEFEVCVVKIHNLKNPVENDLSDLYGAISDYLLRFKDMDIILSFGAEY